MKNKYNKDFEGRRDYYTTTPRYQGGNFHG